jgi:hypothetical protein
VRVSGVACDVCEKVVTGTDKTPEGWFVVFRSVGDNVKTLEKEPSEVCSPQCLCKLGTQLKQLEKAPIPAGGEKPMIPCPICKKPCKGKQGVTMHMTRTHDGLEP